MLELTQFHWMFFPVSIASRCNLFGHLVSTVSVFVRASLALGLINISEVLGETHFLDFVSPIFIEFWKRWWNLPPLGVVTFPCLSFGLFAELVCNLGARLGGAEWEVEARL